MKKNWQILLIVLLFFFTTSILSAKEDCGVGSFCLSIQKVSVNGVLVDTIVQQEALQSILIEVVGVCHKWRGVGHNAHVSVLLKSGNTVIRSQTRRLDAIRSGNKQAKEFLFSEIPLGEYEVQILMRNIGNSEKGEKFFKLSML